VQPLFKNFLRDPAEYDRAEEYWLGMWHSLGEDVTADWTTPWLTQTFANGTPFRSGDGILSAQSRSQQRCFSVNQREVSEGEYLEVVFSVWDPDYDNYPMLVIEVALTECTSEVSRNVIKRWVEGAEPDQVEALANQMLAECDD
jgi:hypothetical protein